MVSSEGEGASLAACLSAGVEDRVSDLESKAKGFVEVVLARGACHSYKVGSVQRRLIGRMIAASGALAEGPASWTSYAAAVKSCSEFDHTWGSPIGSSWSVSVREEHRQKYYGKQHLFGRLGRHAEEEVPLPHNSDPRGNHSLPCSPKR